MKLRHSQQGSFIIEAIISLILFAVGLISLMSLSAQAINQVGQSKARNDASYLVGELLSEMWVSGSVDLDAWRNTRLPAVIPEATGAIYGATCDCAETSSAAENFCQTATQLTGTLAVNTSQAVTVCISWTDRRDSATPRRYQASSMITRNSQ